MFGFGKTSEHATSFTKIWLRLSGMRGSDEYEVVCGGETSEVTQYRIYYRDGVDTREPERSSECPTETIIGLLNQCSVLKWDGFNGPNPRGVRDGWMFRFEAEINGRKIRAEGSNNYPKHYREFFDGINSLLNNGG